MHAVDWDLRGELEVLARSWGLVAIKTGTEVEDMGFEEIAYLRTITAGLLPLYVKIGGPEARNDMRELLRIRVDGLIAPMIESVYALRKFIETLQEVLPPEEYSHMRKGINLETIEGFAHMNTILAAKEARELDQITAARTDLSGSMDLSPDHERVLEICSVICARAREHDLNTSVGGAIHPAIAGRIMELVNPDTMNTRHMVMDCRGPTAARDPALMVQRHLEFEALLYDRLATISPLRSSAYQERAEVIRSRNARARVHSERS